MHGVLKIIDFFIGFSLSFFLVIILTFLNTFFSLILSISLISYPKISLASLIPFLLTSSLCLFIYTSLFSFVNLYEHILGVLLFPINLDIFLHFFLNLTDLQSFNRWRSSSKLQSLYFFFSLSVKGFIT